jgi:hypothetical protein
MVRLIGFWLLPALLLAGPMAIVRRAWRAHRVLTVAMAAIGGAWLVATGVKEPRNAFTGNYFIPEGALGHGVGSGIRLRLVPFRVFELFVAAGTAGAIVMLLAAVPALALALRVVRRRSLPPMEQAQLATGAVALTVFGYVVAYGFAALAGLPLYDRYVLPIVPLVGVLLFAGRGARRVEPDDAVATDTRSHVWRVAGATIAFAVLFAIGLDYTADSASYDGARWRVSEAAVRAGWSPRQIGGNFEWVNFYAPKPGGGGRSQNVCVTVSVGERALARSHDNPIAVGTYNPPFGPSEPVVAYRTRVPCTKSPSAP